MGLKNEIQPYLDSDGLVMPGLGAPSTNGVMYTGEYMIALCRSGQATDADKVSYCVTIGRCMPTPGLLQRNPENTGGQEGPDDYYSLAAALDEIGAELTAKNVIWYGLHHKGSLNNIRPEEFRWNAVLGRQIQLDAVMFWAAGYFVGPIMRLYTALVIALACRGTVAGTDPWRLTWLLVQVASRHSWLCRVASKVWYKRLYKTYPDGMKGVNALYFQKGHPLAKYVIDKV